MEKFIKQKDVIKKAIKDMESSKDVSFIWNNQSNTNLRNEGFATSFS